MSHSLERTERWVREPRWGVLKDHLVAAIVDEFDVDYAIFRTEDQGDGRLIREAFAAAESAPVLDETFAVPREKTARCWSHDPFHAWQISALPGGGLRAMTEDAACRFTAAERNFVDAIRHKASFPVVLQGDVVGLVVLVSVGDRPFDEESVARAWLFAQSFVSSRLGGEEHRGFIGAVEQLPVLAAVPPDQRGQAIAHCLASRNGLRWNRVWLLSSPSATSSGTCVACVGHTDEGSWAEALDRGNLPETSRLGDELRDLVVDRSHESDSLWHVFCESETALECGEFEESYLQDDPTLRPVLVPVEQGSPLVRALDERMPAPSDKVSVGPVFGFVLRGGSRSIVVLLNQAYRGREVPSRLLTCAFLENAVRLLDGPGGAEDVTELIRHWGTVFPLAFNDPDDFRDYARKAALVQQYETDPTARRSVDDKARATLERFLSTTERTHT